MKKQINQTTKAHLVRGAFYLLLLVAICAIPFALAQRNSAKSGAARPSARTNLSSLGSTVPKNNPDFAPFAGSHVQLPSLRPSGSAALATGRVDATGAAVVNTLLKPMLPGGASCLPGTWSTATTGPSARYRAGGCTDGTFVYVYGGQTSTGGFLNDLWRWDPATLQLARQ